MLSQMLLRGRLHLVFDPQCKGGGQFTGYFVGGKLGTASRREADCVGPPAAVFDRIVGNRGGVDGGGDQHGAAQLGVVAQGGKSGIDEPVFRLVQFDRRERAQALGDEAEPERSGYDHDWS